MTFLPILRLAVALLLCLLCAAPAVCEINVVTVRVASVDSLLEEAQRVGSAARLPADRDAILGALPFRTPDGEWLDTSRPLVGVLPQNGFMAADRAWIAVVPVKSTEALQAGLAAIYPQHELEGETRAYTDDHGGEIYVRFLGDYAAAGKLRGFVEGLDVAAALDPRDLPQGPVVGEILFEPLAPFLKMMLAQGRLMAEQRIQAGSAGGSEDLPDMQGITALMDLYFDLADDLLNNVSRLQLAARMDDGNAWFESRLVPTAGSTLAGMLSEQSGALPEIARFTDPADAAWVVAGQLYPTPAFRDALRDYAASYAAAMESLGQSLETMPEMSGFGGWMSGIGSSVAGFVDCYRGDFASVSRFGEQGIETVALAGVEDRDRCQAALDEISVALSQMPATPDGEALVEIEKNAFVYSGVQVTRQSVRMPTSGDPDLEQTVARMWGGPSVSSLYGLHRDLMLTVSGGAGAEQSFRDLVDRTSARPSGAGIPAGFFLPLVPGPGFFARIDFDRLLAGFPEMDDVGGAANLGGIRGAVVLGARFSDDAVSVEVALPASLWTGEPAAAEDDAAARAVAP